MSAAACALIGRALLFRYGAYDSRALGCVLGAGLCVLVAVGFAGKLDWRRLSLRSEVLLAWALAALTIYELRLGWSDGPFHTAGELQRSQQLLAGLGLGAVLAASSRRSAVRWMSLGLVTTSAAALFALLLSAVPPPFIDVIMFQDEGARALLSLHNPYSLRFPNIYGHPWYYGSALVDGARLKFGFPYPPASLMLSTLGYAIAADHRWAQAAAVLLSGLLMGLGGGRIGVLMAAVMFATPRGLFVVECGWTEPFAVACLCAVAFLESRHSRWTLPALGLFWAIKQYVVLTIPLAWLLLPDAQRSSLVAWATLRTRWSESWSGSWRVLAWLLGPAALITLPFVLWDPKSFWFDMVSLHFYHPFREDALSLLAFWARRGTPVLPNVLGFLGCGLAMAIALWRAPRSVSGFCAATGLTLLAFFVVNKAAFANYYYLVLGCFACAAAFAFAGASYDEPRWIDDCSPPPR